MNKKNHTPPIKSYMCNDRTALYIIITIAMIGIIGVVCATRWGIGITPDSVNYIGVARNVVKGRGFIKPNPDKSGKDEFMTNWPPLYPLILAMIGIFGIDPLNGARFLSLFLFAVNILLIGLIIRKHTKESMWPSVCGSLLMATSVAMLGIHSMAWTEPLFVFLTLLGFILLALYMENARVPFLVASSFVVGCALITRYPGLTLIITCIIGLFFLSAKTIQRKIIDIFIFGSISCTPLLLWVMRNMVREGTATNRSMAFHPLTSDHINRALSTFSQWLLPRDVPSPVRNFFLLVVIIGLLYGAILVLLRENRRDMSKSLKECLKKIPKILGLLLIFVFIYLVFLAVSISFFDAHTRLDNRILSPIYVASLILIICLIYRLIFSGQKIRVLQIICIVMCLGFSGSYVFRSTKWIINNYHFGQEYASKAWKHSEILEIVRGLPSGIPIFSNAPDAIYIHTGRPASMIPAKIDASTRQINESCISDLKNMWTRLKADGGVVVYLNAIRRWYLVTENELKKFLSLSILSQKADGTIYKANTVR
ncbi:MAG: ArnT family glycosyltransferase [bacterium]